MSLRESLHDTAESIFGTKTDLGNAESVDSKPGILRYIYLFYAIIAVIVIVGVIIARAKYPEWYKKNQETADKITAIVDKPTYIVMNATKLKMAEGEEKLENVGNGRHPEIRRDPLLKQKYFFDGYIFMKKDYVRESEYLPPAERERLNKKGGLNFPVFDVTWIEAAEYCAGLGSGYRLPTHAELVNASELMEEKEAKEASSRTFFDFQKNLEFKSYETKCEWTGTQEPTEGGFFSFLSNLNVDDNYRVYCPGSKDVVYYDDTDTEENISFRCAKEPKKGD